MRISDWSSDVCSSDLREENRLILASAARRHEWRTATSRRETSPWRPSRHTGFPGVRSEERREGTSLAVRVDMGGRRIIKNKNHYRSEKLLCAAQHLQSLPTTSQTNHTNLHPQA